MSHLVNLVTSLMSKQVSPCEQPFSVASSPSADSSPCLEKHCNVGFSLSLEVKLCLVKVLSIVIMLPKSKSSKDQVPAIILNLIAKH